MCYSKSFSSSLDKPELSTVVTGSPYEYLTMTSDEMTSIPSFTTDLPENTTSWSSTESPLSPESDCEPGIQCQFDNDCDCGYTYVSSNINSTWSLQSADNGRLINATTVGNNTGMGTI